MAHPKTLINRRPLGPHDWPTLRDLSAQMTAQAAKMTALATALADLVAETEPVAREMPRQPKNKE